MGNLLASVVGFIGGPFGVGGAVIGDLVGVPVSGGLLGDILGIGGVKSKKPETTESPIRTARPPRVSAYGRSRLYGAYVLYETAPNGTAVDIYAMHDGQLDAIEVYYLADDAVTLTGTVVNEGDDGRYRDGAINIYTTDGSSPGAGFPAIQTLLPGIWTSDHRGDGVVGLALTAKSVKSKVFQETYPASTVPAPSIVARWQKCPDPSAVDPLDESGWAWTENPVRQLLHYKLTREGPRPALPETDPDFETELTAMRAAWWARKIAPTLDYWQDASDVCDEAVALLAGGTEPRYRSLVSHKHTDKHEGVAANLVATFDGWICPRTDGALIVYAGKYYAPDPVDDLIGPDQIVAYTWNGGAVDDDLAINEIICSYYSSVHDYNSVECDAWRDEADIGKRGQILSDAQDIFVPSHGQARRLAKRRMQKMLAADRGSVTTNIAGRHARGKRYIWLTLAEAGTTFYDGPAEIIKMSRALQGGVTFDWVAADPNIDAWNPATEEGLPAADGSRVAPSALTAPEITAFSVTFDGTGARAALTVDSPDRSDLTWFAHWRAVGAGVWGPDEQSTDADPGTAVSLVTGYLPLDSEIEIQVAYQVGDGRVSEWSIIETVDTDTAALAPAPPTSVAAADGTGSSVVSWRNPNSTNFAYARVYRATSASFGSAAQVGGDMPGGLGELMDYTNSAAAGTYYYWVRAFNAGGVGSAPVGPDSAVIT